MTYRIFVTGATGYLGNAIARRLLRGGHQVFGLTRAAERARGLADAGIQPVVGDLADADTFLSELKNCDSVVHAAFQAGPEASRQDQRALEAIQAAVEDGRVRRVLYTSGIWVYGDRPGMVVDEDTPVDPPELVAWRPPHEEVVLDLLEHDEAAPVVLRPGMVYGGAGGILGGWFREARDTGTLTYPGGEQHWCMVHVHDLADAYALALEHAAPGARFLLADESRFTVRQLAAAAAAVSGARAVAWAPDEVRAMLGGYGEALLLDLQATAARARRELGWTPMHASFVAEAEAIHREWLSGQGAQVV
jgi:nucleoside-diphosphate-sugar epimerase